MIQLPELVAEVITERIAPANSASFIWRKLAENSTVQYWSSKVPQDELLESLRVILGRETLNEIDQISVYCIAVALLLQNRRLVNDLRALDGIEKAFWLRHLVDYASDHVAGTNYVRLFQKPRSSTNVASVLSPNSSLVITVGRDR